MKTIFHIISRFDIGGAERVALNISKSKSAGFRYHLIEIFSGDKTAKAIFMEEMRNANIVCHPTFVKNKYLGILSFPFRLLYFFLRYRPDVFHTHTEIPDVALILAYSMFPFLYKRIKIVRTIHNNILWSNWKKTGRVAESFFKSRNANVAISYATSKTYKDEYGSQPPVIHNGVPHVQQRAFPGVISGKINVLYAGRLEQQKGIDILVKIIHELNSDKSFFFHIIGDGSMKHQMLESLRGCDNYMYYGKILHLSSYFSSFDYLIMPSWFEGLALTPLEAALAKLPPIINDCKGLIETVPDNWRLVAHDNSLSDYLKIFKSLDFGESLGEDVFNYVSEQFSIVKMQQKYETMYRS